MDGGTCRKWSKKIIVFKDPFIPLPTGVFQRKGLQKTVECHNILEETHTYARTHRSGILAV